ncbi:porin [Desulfatitalea alkaliphila]|uniref:Porin n=1 Tax=Desulfatitalea alkaliphila TaxID=2929485 RepID=A0AA41R755_9BACT|nr:porin [Desulfatitalea alkaliphila]MCJ8502717.1 porin [Desulfatitalea alkaliphila]
MKQIRSKFGYGVLAVLLILPFLATPAAALEAKLSGQVNQLFMWADDGDRTDVFVADNANSSTRFRFTASEDFGKVKIGTHLEFDAQRNSSFALSMDQNNDGAFNWNDRWMNIYFDTAFGKFEIGKGSGAADTTSESDLSGTGVINYSGVADTAGGFMFKQGNGVDFGARVGQVRSNFDGIGRSERIRYNTPSFGGLKLATSFTNGEAYEFGAFYAADFAGNKLAASVGYVDGNQRNNFKQFSGSLSWLMPFGLNITGAYGERDIDQPNRLKAYHYYFKLGYKFDIHALSVEYGWNENLRINNEDSSNWGVAYVITPWKPVEFFVSYRQYMLQAASGPDPDDIRQAMVGSRVKF